MAEEKKLPMIVKTVEKSGFMEIKLRDLQNNSEWVHRGVPASTGGKKLD